MNGVFSVRLAGALAELRAGATGIQYIEGLEKITVVLKSLSLDTFILTAGTPRPYRLTPIPTRKLILVKVVVQIIVPIFVNDIIPSLVYDVVPSVVNNILKSCHTNSCQ